MGAVEYLSSPPTLSIDNVTLYEGNSGTKIFTFTVSMSGTNAQGASVTYATADGTATTTGSDYVASTQTLTWDVGDTSPKTISITVNGDTTLESDEFFFVNLTNPVGATIADGQGQGKGTILNDDVNQRPWVVPATPAGTQTGHVTITYSLFDPDSDTCGIVVKYADGSKNPDGSLKWNIAKAVSGLGDGTNALVSSPTGVSHTFVWDGGSDLANTCNSIVEICITPSDPGGDGAIAATGNFTTTNHSQGAPTVGSVVVAEAAAPKNGVNECNDGLKITWAATGPNSIGKQTVKVDGTLVASSSSNHIPGPYGGQYYACQIATRTAGTHTYTITTTDTKGLSFTYTSSFNVAAPVLPYVGSVVVAEAAAPKNGVLENDEKLRITWAASSSNVIAAQTMTVDGKPIAPINGPYGAYYSCTIGTWSAGTHTYVIAATDLKGVTFNCTGTFAVIASQVPTPVISSPVVAEAAAPKNGMLDSNDPLRITWAATSQDPIASQSVTVDGRRFTTVGGPYGHNYSCSIGAWSAGTHDYSITATNASGFSSTYSGSFSVTDPIPSATPPVTIGSVVVAEAAAPKNGILESTEMLVITWAASSPYKIASQAMTIDGRTVSPIYGPYGGLYYSCPIGAWSAGTHTYVITATSASIGFTFNRSGTFTVADNRADLLANVMHERADSLGALPSGPASETDSLDLVFATIGDDGKRV